MFVLRLPHQHHAVDEVWQGRLIWRVHLVSATWRTAGDGRHEAPLLLQSKILSSPRPITSLAGQAF